jgi:hypothetical protein
MAPIFRRMANHPAFELHVSYCTLRGAEAAHDAEFGENIKWDVPLLDGYSCSHVRNRGSGAESFFGLFNADLWKLIRVGNFDAILCFTGYRHAAFWIALFAAKLSKTAFLFGTDATNLAPRDGRAWKIIPKNILWPRLFRLAADLIVLPSEYETFAVSGHEVRSVRVEIQAIPGVGRVLALLIPIGPLSHGVVGLHQTEADGLRS